MAAAPSCPGRPPGQVAGGGASSLSGFRPAGLKRGSPLVGPRLQARLVGHLKAQLGWETSWGRCLGTFVSARMMGADQHDSGILSSSSSQCKPLSRHPSRRNGDCLDKAAPLRESGVVPGAGSETRLQRLWLWPPRVGHAECFDGCAPWAGSGRKRTAAHVHVFCHPDSGRGAERFLLIRGARPLIPRPRRVPRASRTIIWQVAFATAAPNGSSETCLPGGLFDGKTTFAAGEFSPEVHLSAAHGPCTTSASSGSNNTSLSSLRNHSDCQKQASSKSACREAWPACLNGRERHSAPGAGQHRPAFASRR